jgi:hypothetical protein
MNSKVCTINDIQSIFHVKGYSNTISMNDHVKMIYFSEYKVGSAVEVGELGMDIRRSILTIQTFFIQIYDLLKSNGVLN